VEASFYYSALQTQFGTIQIAVEANGVVTEVWLPNRRRGPVHEGTLPRSAERGTRDAHAQLREYFEGKRRAFDLPIDPRGSPFECSVWERLRGIPYGETTSYGAIAAGLGMLNGARAVGRANGRNPIPIIIPCHRVIGANGTLTGFGGGIALKQSLLELEGAARPELRLF